MQGLPPIPDGFELEPPSRVDPFDLARSAGFTVTNGYRTPADIERLRRNGYNPAPNSAHLRADAMDLVNPNMTPRQMIQWGRQHFGDWPDARILYHDRHLHLTLPGWGAAPGTPGTRNSGLPELPEGFELVQRGSLSGVDWDAQTIDAGAAPAPPPPPAPDRSAAAALPPPPPGPGERRDINGNAIPDAPPGTEVQFGMDHPFGAPEPPPEPWTPAQQAAYDAYMRDNPRASASAINAYMIAQGTQGISNIDEIVRHRDAGGRPAPGSSARFGPRPAELREHHPDLAERAGQVVSSALEPIMGRYAAAEQGRNTDDFLSQVTPVGAIDAANEYEAGRQRALQEGRFADAAGNAFGRDANVLMALPIIGPGRAAARATAARALEHIGEAAARRGAGDAARMTDAELSAFVQRHADELPDDVRTYLREGGDFSENHIATIRATARPNAVQRGVAAVRRGLGRGERGAADDVAEAVEDLPPPSAGSSTPDIPPPGRTVDRIEVRDLPPLPPGFQLEEPLGRVAPLGEPIPPETLADVARSIRPGDVTPIPANRIESEAEAIRANPGTVQDVPIPDEQAVRGPRTVRTFRGAALPWRGPVDAETFLRSHGGLRDQGGELRHMGITDNTPRSDVARDRFVGPILRPEGMSLDDARELLAEAGFIDDGGYADEVLEVLRAGRGGSPVYRPDDMAEAAEIAAARSQRWEAEAAEANGAPIASRVGEPASLDDIDANAPPATAYEDLPNVGGTVGNINLGHLETSTDIRRLLQNVEVRFGGFDAARRGVITHAETRALADELGMTATDLLRRRRGQALNAEQALAARQLLARSSDEVIDLARRATGPDASDATRAAFSEALLRHAAIHEQVTGATAEAGRALQAMRMAARSRAVSNRIHEAIADGMGGQGRLEDVAGRILDLQRQGVTPGQVHRFAVAAVQPRFRDKLVELWYNSLLSGPQTHAVNMLSNAMTQVLQIPEQVAASALGQVRRGVRAARGRPDDYDRVLASEIGPRVVGLMQGAREGFGNFRRTLATGDVPDFVTKVESRTQRAISGVKGEVVRIPSRLLAAEDEFFKATARRMEINGLAVRQARREGLHPIRHPERFRERVADLAQNPTDEMLERAMERARYLTFQSPLGRVGQRISATTQDHPWLKLFLPFIRTPTNIFKYAIERSPAAPILRAVRDDIRAGGERRDLAMARMALGTGLGLTMAHLASLGIITGGGPADASAESMMRADGWQPYSIRIGDTYYSYARLDPLSTTIGVAADMVDFQQHMTESQQREAGALLIASVIRNLGNKTWLSGASDMMEAISDPQRHLPTFIGRLGGSIAVPTGVSQIARWVDPVQRDISEPTFGATGHPIADRVMGTIQSRIPGVSDDLPARRDVWGEEVRNEGGLGPDLISPIWTSTASNDPIIAELLNLGVSVGRPSRRVGGRRLNAQEYGRYQELSGRYMRSDLQEAMSDPGWSRMTPDERQSAVSRIKRTARADARADLATDAPPLPPGFELVQ